MKSATRLQTPGKTAVMVTPRHGYRRVLLALAVTATLLAMTATAGRAQSVRAGERADMVRIPAGSYRPLYSKVTDNPVAVAPFRIDRAPVTRRDFLAFVQKNSGWQKSQVNVLFANRNDYLQDWPGDLDAGKGDDLERPVTNVSWFAARAYCEAQNKRLPTLTEWEYAAAASGTAYDAARDHSYIAFVMQQYATRTVPARVVRADDANAFGVRGMHSSVWEWVDDFNSILVSDDSRGVSARDNGMYCASAAIGAVDPSNFPAFLRSAFRAGLRGNSSLPLLGFRCAL